MVVRTIELFTEDAGRPTHNDEEFIQNSDCRDEGLEPVESNCTQCPRCQFTLVRESPWAMCTNCGATWEMIVILREVHL